MDGNHHLSRQQYWIGWMLVMTMTVTMTKATTVTILLAETALMLLLQVMSCMMVKQSMHWRKHVNSCCLQMAFVLLADPKKERFHGARDHLRISIGKDFHFEIVDLPLRESALGDAAEATTVDGIDHLRRLQEPTVLIQIKQNA
jgi:hypothetical protein